MARNGTGGTTCCPTLAAGGDIYSISYHQGLFLHPVEYVSLSPNLLFLQSKNFAFGRYILPACDHSVGCARKISLRDLSINLSQSLINHYRITHSFGAIISSCIGSLPLVAVAAIPLSSLRRGPLCPRDCRIAPRSRCPGAPR